MPKPTLKLGELLIKEGLITEKDLEEAIKLQKKKGGRIGEILVKMKVVSEENIIATLGKQLNIPYYSRATGMLKPVEDQALEKLVSEEFARTHLVLPLSKTLNSLTVAFVDPLDLIVRDNLKKMTKCEINPVVATESDIEKALDEFYGSVSLLHKAVDASYEAAAIEEVDLEAELKAEELSLDKLISKAEEAPVIKLVNLLIMQAIKDRASDIHIEPFEKMLSIRYRIDGILYEIPPPAWHLYLPIVSRVKILSKLDIAEKRLPQDGSFHLRVENRLIDVRVSTMPTVYGEKVVMRILDKSAAPLNIDGLGLTPDVLKIYKDAITKPYGLILLTGPTGSGKTTTLYASLNFIKSPKKNIITIEDPVEYRIEGINQVEVKPHIGLTFASGLRHTLRQDPDIVLVGEVRDLETAEICIRAALTGHLVLSTLHTNDAPTAITRLVDIGIGPFLVGSSLLLVAAQRLVRLLCPECKEPYKPDPAVADIVGKDVEKIYRRKGCDYCLQTGYKGRAALFELLTVNEEIRSLITRGGTAGEIARVAQETGMKTLWESGIEKVRTGETALEEVYAVTYTGEE